MAHQRGQRQSRDLCARLRRRDPISRRLFRGDKSKERLDWAQNAVRKRGGTLIILGRFIPGGRTATTFAAGTLELDYRHRFLPADVLAALFWSILWASPYFSRNNSSSLCSRIGVAGSGSQRFAASATWKTIGSPLSRTSPLDKSFH